MSFDKNIINHRPYDYTATIEIDDISPTLILENFTRDERREVMFQVQGVKGVKIKLSVHSDMTDFIYMNTGETNPEIFANYQGELYAEVVGSSQVFIVIMVKLETRTLK